MSTTVTSKGQVTIPKAVRDYLGIRAGAAVDFRLDEDGRVVLLPEESNSGPAPASPFANVRGSATAGMTTDEIMALTRAPK